MKEKQPLTIRVGTRLMDLSSPKIMAIVNATPDSFFSESRLMDASAKRDKRVISQNVKERVHKVLEEGADIIDIGAYSTRPGCTDISPEEEWERLNYALKGAREAGGEELIISVDTFRAEIARRCVEEWGVGIINDIGGGTLDDKMFSTVAQLKVAYVLMHIKGTPQTMTQFAGEYNDVTREVIQDLAFKADTLHSLGVADVILDPGFRFAKDLKEHFQLLSELNEFARIGLPILCGLSRKSMIWQALGITPNEALNGTTALNMMALMNGANILRVHDVKEAKECKMLYEELRKSQELNY